jgi:ABC-2 type transport system permease protein
MLKDVMKFAVKDFTIQKKNILNYMLIGVVLTIVFSLLNIFDRHTLFSIVIFVIVYGFVNKALYEDEKSNTLRLLASIPVKREAIVYARYLSAGIMLVFTSCLLLALSYIVTGGKAAAESSGIGILASLAIVIVFVVMLSVYLPLAFKLGYIKAAGINRFIFLGLFAFFGAASVAIGGLRGGETAESVGNMDAFLSSLNLNAMILLLIAAGLLIYICSMWLSAALFRKRDLF